MKRILIILSFIFSLYSATNAQQGLKVVEGKEGIWLFYSNEILGSGNSKEFSTATIQRAEAGGSYKEAGSAQPLFDLNEMKKRYGNDFPSITAEYLNLKSEGELVDFMRQHPSLDDYGFLAFDLYFMQATGAAFVDVKKPATGTKLKYRVQLKSANGNELAQSEEVEITVGLPIVFNPVSLSSKKESDSAVMVTWKAVNKASEPFYFANVYRSTAGSGNYVYAGKVFASAMGDTSTFTWSENVVPGGLYKYYIRPTNMVGLEAKPSDTVGVIAADFDKVPRLENFTAKDTTGGIFFSWNPLKTDVMYSGIAVMRKPMNSEGYVPMDTIPAGSATYFDNRIIPNIVYQYEFRLVNLRWKPLPPSASTTAIHRTGGKNQHTPFALKAEPVKEGIKITWKPIAHYDVNGYYVYRSVNGDDYKLQSSLLKDTFFIDNDATNGRTLYNYAVTSLNFSDVESNKSNTVQAKPFNTIIPVAPKGVSIYQEAGKTTVQWNNTKNDDGLITGYFVYRKEGTQDFNKIYTPEELKKAGFIKLNETPVETPVYTDTKTTPGKTYTYAVTSIDANAAESNAEQFSETTAAKVRIAAPSFFGLTKSTAGVIISWDTDLNKTVSDYSIYRRTRSETGMQLIGTVKASQLSYTDKTAQSGIFYFYAIKAKTATGSESDLSLEKGIAR